VITSAAAEFSAGKGNLADNQLLIRTNTVVETEGDNIGGPFIPARTPDELASLEAQVAEITTVFNNPTIIPIEAAFDPTMQPDNTFGGRPTVTLAEYTDLGGINGYRDLTLLYVATPELLAQYGIDLETVATSTEILTVETSEIRLVGTTREPGTKPELVANFEQLSPTFSSLPGSFIMPHALHQHSWETTPVGWLIEANVPLTDEQIASARQIAADVGLTIESRDYQEGLLALRSRATAAGLFVALGVLVMTVGLIRSEAAADLRTLTATGATSRIRRTLTAVTAGTLALLGALLGAMGAYLALIAGYMNDLMALSHVPIFNLLLILLGIPLLAFVGGWLLAGREPATLARQLTE
jgi:putative ABC transport system permease protein